MEAVVDGVAAPSALSEDLPVFETGKYVFDACTDTPVRAVVVVVDDPAAGAAPRAGDGGDAAVSAVTQEQRAPRRKPETASAPWTDPGATPTPINISPRSGSVCVPSVAQRPGAASRRSPILVAHARPAPMAARYADIGAISCRAGTG